MRKSIRRGGALWLTLLLQVFVLSGFVHPCCLGGMDGMQASHAGMHGDAAPGQDGDHGAMDHGAMDHGAMEQGVHVDHAPAGDGHAHELGQPDEDVHECPGCDGTCELCCQTPGAGMFVRTVQPGAVADGPTLLVGPPPSAKVSFPRAPAFLLPFANGPPLSPVAIG